MSFNEFLRLVEEARVRNPVWFELDRDLPASAEELSAAEERLLVKLPEGYRNFVRTFGGGHFAFANVFSVTPGSEWNIVDRNTEASIPAFIAVSDNGCGDFYGFRVEEGVCSDAVFLSEHEASHTGTSEFYACFFEFLADVALRPRDRR